MSDEVNPFDRVQKKVSCGAVAGERERDKSRAVFVGTSSADTEALHSGDGTSADAARPVRR
jgi:hypothetical protein